MQAWTYPARFDDHGDDGFVVTFPDFPEAVTGAVGKADATLEAIDALGVVIREYLAQGRTIPGPREAGPGEESIPLDPLTAARAALSRRMAAEHLTNVAVAARMGKSEVQVRRILNGHGGVRWDGVLEALRAVGMTPTLMID